MELKNVAVIVTGGGSGLGAATARRLAAGGARVTVFDLDAERGTRVASEVRGHFILVDVTRESEVEAAIREAEEKHGTARILVNCAGIAPPAKIVDRDGRPLPLAAFSKIVSVNLLGTFNMLSKFAARVYGLKVDLPERAVIINTASVAAFEGQIGQSAYAASKAGVVGMTLPAARELARYGIRVMTIAPGIFRTPMLESLPAEAQESLGRQVPFPNRVGEPEEYAQLVESIIANPMLNGEVIRIDGAMRMAAR